MKNKLTFFSGLKTTD